MELSVVRERILATPLAKKLPEEMKQRFVMVLLWVADTVDVSREEVLFQLGDRGTKEGCLILEGMVRIKTESNDTKTIEAPDILGEVQLFTPDGFRTATVEVVVGGKILKWKWKDWSREAQAFYTADEWNTLKLILAKSAGARDSDLFPGAR
jgi:hypothetical protein